MLPSSTRTNFEDKIIDIKLTSEHPEDRPNQYVKDGVTYGFNCRSDQDASRGARDCSPQPEIPGKLSHVRCYKRSGGPLHVKPANSILQVTVHGPHYPCAPISSAIGG